MGQSGMAFSILRGGSDAKDTIIAYVVPFTNEFELLRFSKQATLYLPVIDLEFAGLSGQRTTFFHIGGRGAGLRLSCRVSRPTLIGKLKINFLSLKCTE